MARVNGRKMKEFRDQLGWSQEDVAKQANVSHNTISRLETGEVTNPRLDTLSAIAHALGVKVRDILEEE